MGVSTAHSPFRANRVALAWTAGAAQLPYLVSFLESLTLENCAAPGAVILVHGQLLPSSLPTAMSASGHTCLYRLAPSTSLPLDSLARPAHWELARISREAWTESLGLFSMQRPAIVFSEAPLIQAIM
ncbi:hypothetical protein ACELLULO517_14795 [Acidisoma cellulosilytica]|uniref:Uncharacterized protein n=1 Tax=Acidisoma cellulosilyticum TaxID=2802395 RepID=A0A963Z2V2_9PROT|nr:hypothetical protein [Acidisoma cellulosilyticum]MCB8881516.1 hypothetical protein [Acidisoma cellulosilyticum]